MVLVVNWWDKSGWQRDDNINDDALFLSMAMSCRSMYSTMSIVCFFFFWPVARSGLNAPRWRLSMLGSPFTLGLFFLEMLYLSHAISHIRTHTRARARAHIHTYIHNHTLSLIHTPTYIYIYRCTARYASRRSRISCLRALGLQARGSCRLNKTIL